MAFITGKDLRAMRTHAGLRTSDMADLAGVKTRKTYENWEKNVGSPSINQFVAMCLGCKFSPATLVDLVLDRELEKKAIDLTQASEV